MQPPYPQKEDKIAEIVLAQQQSLQIKKEPYHSRIIYCWRIYCFRIIDLGAFRSRSSFHTLCIVISRSLCKKFAEIISMDIE